MNKLIVLIPHYNNFQQLIESIKSIDESINVDLLIVDDGSTKEIPIKSEIEKNYKNGKVFLDYLNKNQGIEHALNRGLYLIENMGYQYIGRLDCGDYCMKNRFLKQISYLERNKDTHLLGSWVNMIDSSGRKLFVLKHPVTYKEIKRNMYLNSMFVHPSVVYRANILKVIGYYPTNFKAAEDYAFFFKIVKKFKAENLAEPLLNYVIDENSISSTRRRLQVRNRIRVILSNYYFGIYPTYGLIRNALLFFMSRGTATKIKSILKKNNGK